MTLNTVPVTATWQSAVATYRWPCRRLAACTMMLPRLSRMVRSVAAGGRGEAGALAQFH